MMMMCFGKENEDDPFCESLVTQCFRMMGSVSFEFLFSHFVYVYAFPIPFFLLVLSTYSKTQSTGQPEPDIMDIVVVVVRD
jgi:hypothetical protein